MVKIFQTIQSSYLYYSISFQER